MHWLFLSSLTGGVFLLAALVLRSCLKHVLPKSFLVKLWLAVLVNFLLFFPLPSPTSIHNFVKPVLPNESWTRASGDADVRPPSGGDAVMRMGTAPLPDRDASWRAALFPIWLALTAGLLLYFLASYWRTATVFRKAVPIDGEPAIRDWLDARPGGRVSVFSSASIVSPVSYGLFKASIVLPHELDLNDSALLHGVLEHEYVHCRHLHNPLKAVVYVVVAVHWFNPLAWVFLFLFSHDLELACDESVLERLGRGVRADYARSLLSVAGPGPLSPRLLSPFSARNIKERVVNIMAFESPRARMRILEAAVVVAAFAVFGTVAVGSQVIRPSTSVFTGYYGLPGARTATDLALSASGGGAIVKAELESVDGRREYEFIIVSRDIEHRVTIDAGAMSIIGHERGVPGRYYGGIATARFIPVEQACETALQALGSMGGKGEVTGFSLEYDVKAGKYNYEIEVQLLGEELDVEMDAGTGVIRKISVDI